MRSENRRRVPAGSRAAEKQAATVQQLTVLVLGAIALLGFLITV